MHKKHSWTCAILGVVCLVVASDARAQPGTEGQEPAPRLRRPGTHFIAEINVGGGLSGGMSVGGLVGVGGKLKRFPPRFYLVAEFAHATRFAEGSLPDLPLAFEETWRFNDAALGLRIYVPIYRHVRILIDLMGGCSRIKGDLLREGMNRLGVEGWRPLGQFATGIQVRPFYHLSLGVRAKVALTGEGTSALEQLAGSEQTGPRATLTGGLTWHF
jgi:hypothetical protein